MARVVVDTTPSVRNDPIGTREPFRVLAIDGGGSKGMFSVGALVEIEAALGTRCSELFDLVYGTSVGSIVAALVATAHSAEDIAQFFLQEIPGIMRPLTAKRRSRALRDAVVRLLGERRFEDLHTQLGIVATRTDRDRPMIFKTSSGQAIKGALSFVPGFGATLADAVMASCAARPFFDEAVVSTPQGAVGAIDGGFVANNPSLFALIDAVHTLKIPPERVAVLSVGVGSYPSRTSLRRNLLGRYWSTRLLETSLSANANAMQILTGILFGDVSMVRIDRAYSDSRYATWFLESEPEKLRQMIRLGQEECREREQELVSLLRTTD